MTTIAASPLPDTLQSLVDARLDTIDRMLLGRVNRHDRLAIVREVESQIFDLLQGRDSEALDRDDVLAVLARLDPPEAYLPDESSGEPNPTTRVAMVPGPIRPARESGGRAGLASGILGIISIAVEFLSVPIILLARHFGNLVFLGSGGLTFITSLLAVVLAARVRLKGPWAIVGLVTGILALLLEFVGFFLRFVIR